MSNNTDSLRLLVLAGANVNVRGLSGPLLHDALQFIFFKRSYAMMLIAAGADVATPDFRGQNRLPSRSYDRRFLDVRNDSCWC
jgi:hypothetical protein